MSKGSRVNALLVEILLAILFFALSATVILQCFSAAYEQANRAEARDRALYAAEDRAQALRDRGFSEDESWVLEGEGWRLSVSLDSQAAGAGVMETAEILATAGETALFRLPVARYLPKEAVQ